MVFINGVGILRDPVTQGDELAVIQLLLKRLMIMTGDDSLVTCGKDCFRIGF
ncbi:MAG: hypothetical protein RQ722_00855 [Desulfuromonadales bacterium]|nr:hypothetical protein [Desulfuromonadales bacterium]